MKRTPLKRRTPLLSRASLRRVSRKREAQRLDYEQARAVVVARDKVCQGPKHGLWNQCHGVLDPHHIFPTSRYPDRRCDPEAMILLCRFCHEYVHNHPLWARAQGLLV